ncbi:MAG: hypothetical protein WB676_04830 [Bryobacteraceae bacterium]
MQEELSDQELREIHRLVQQAALTAHPNPERVGCPGAATLAEMAALRRPWDHRAHEHVSQCSPCLKEMLNLRGHRGKKRFWSNKWLLSAIAAALIIGICIPLAVHQRKLRINELEQAHAAIMNFATGSILRGAPSGESGVVPGIQTYPRERLTLTVSLPRGSEGGEYDFQVLGTKGEILIARVGHASIARGLTTFITDVDFSGLPPGSYRARVRHKPFGDWQDLTIQTK